MDAKLVVSGALGIGLVALAGLLIMKGESDHSGSQTFSETVGRAVELDAETSAYELEQSVSEQPAATDNAPRNLQQPRRDARDGPGRGRFGVAQMEERIIRFDINGDGILDETERDAMAGAMRQRMIDRFDADGDGVVSIEEQFAARRDFMLNSPRGQRMRNEFDVDGDGELSIPELAAMNAMIDERESERMAQIISEYDTDEDGAMSLEETIAMQDQQFADRRSRMDQFAIEFDEDGDGNLNADERADAMNSMIQQRELDSFLNRYDTNKDGDIGTRDTERFTDAYGNKEPYADVNRDGIYNMDDVAMFRDMTERLNAIDQ